MKKTLTAMLTISLAMAAAAGATAAPTLVNGLPIGMGTDLSGEPAEGAQNRLGGLFSDLYFDRATGYYYGLGDRGPGGGVLPYSPRVQKFTLDVNKSTGAIGGFKLVESIVFQQPDGTPFTGLNPQLDPRNGSKASLGRSFDPEGFVIGRNGNFFVSDEYGPSVKEFTPSGKLVREFTPPANLVPRAGGTPNYVDGRSELTSGRQDNRGFEGLAITPDGKYLVAALQDPLVTEGANNDGRRSRNVRLVKFSVETGEAVGQYVYPLDSVADINSNLPADKRFNATAQGRNIGLSAIIAINENEFLVIERDNRGLGVENPDLTNGDAADYAALKRVYKVNLNGATDVSEVSLTGTNTLPAGVTPVQKTMFLDLLKALEAAGLPVTEKFEGITFGDYLEDGGMSFIVGIDNDFSVTQTGSGTQFDICAGKTFAGAEGISNAVPLGGACPEGTALIDNWLYGFKISADELARLGYVPQQRVSEPVTAALMGLGLAGLGWTARRRRSRAG